jgi:DNA-binding IscR family transcriptional regulator
MESVKEKAERILSCMKTLKEVGEATSFELISRCTNINDDDLWKVVRYMEDEGMVKVVTMDNGQEQWHYLVRITRGIEEGEDFDYM